MSVLINLLLLILFAICGTAYGHPNVDELALSVAAKTDVPAELVKNVCIHESQSFYKGGRQAWPWTLNVGGKGYWFRNRHSAVRYANIMLVRGVRNIDVGICQINWRWHGYKFKSVDELIDPERNMLYAANTLKQLKGEKSWQYAVGAYHAPGNKKRSDEYAKKVLKRVGKVNQN